MESQRQPGFAYSKKQAKKTGVLLMMLTVDIQSVKLQAAVSCWHHVAFCVCATSTVYTAQNVCEQALQCQSVDSKLHIAKDQAAFCLNYIQ